MTPRQSQIHAFILAYTAKNHWPPTVREIASHVGIVPSAVHFHLVRMEKIGVIEREYGISRGVRVCK